MKPNARRGYTATRHDHYQEVTDRIVAALEAGRKPWQKPWDPTKAGESTLPVNAVTGRRYRGINILVLGLSPKALTSDDPRWCSYKQAQERGWQIRRGETGTTIFFFKRLEIDNSASTAMDSSPDSGDGTTRFIPMLRAFTVFHASQIEGVPDLEIPKAERPVFERIEDAEIIMRNSGAEVRIGGDRAYYCPATDHIQLPPDFTFRSPASYAAVELHELGHWCGAPNRLARKLDTRFGTEAYSREELRVELASAMICSTLGLPTDIENHASYVGSWVETLKTDKREIFKASADAQKIADYLLAFHPHHAESGFRADTVQDGKDGDPKDDEALDRAA